jgi:hypothetical protein
VTVDPRALFVDQGDILTSAGSTASIDLCLHVVRRDYGTEIATQLARQLVVPPQHDGGQAQYIEAPMDNLRAAARCTPASQQALVIGRRPGTGSFLPGRPSARHARRFRLTASACVRLPQVSLVEASGNVELWLVESGVVGFGFGAGAPDLNHEGHLIKPVILLPGEPSPVPGDDRAAPR